MGYERVGRRLLEYAVRVPSFYNSQPWRFTLKASQGVIEVWPEPTRARGADLDPGARETHLALGASVEAMALAAPSLGHMLKVEAFPEGPNGPAARLTLSHPGEVMPEPLFTSLLNRHSHAGAYAPEKPAEVQLDRLKLFPAPSAEEKVHLLIEEPKVADFVKWLHDLSHEASQDKALVEEGARWIRPNASDPTGLPMDFLALPISVKVRFALLRYFNYAKEIREVSRQALLKQGHGVEAPAYLLITTTRPGYLGFFESGRYLEGLQLTLTDMDLAFQCLYPPVGLRHFRGELQGFFGAGEKQDPVALLRFGKPLKKDWPISSRLMPEGLVKS